MANFVQNSALSTSRVTFREINRLALPAAVAGIVEPLISLTDVAVAGHLPQNSTAALAAVGIVGSFLSALIWVLAQTKTATSALVSRYLGAGRLSRIRGLIPQALLFNFLLSLLILLSSLYGSGLIFETFFKARGLTLRYCLHYFHIRIWGFPLTLLTFTIFGVFRGLQNTSWAMQISLVGGLLNAGLDLLFAYGFGWSVQGIAYASLLAQFIMFVLACIYFFRKTQSRLWFPRRWHPEFKPWLFISINLFIRTLALNLAIVLGNRFATSYGTAAIAAQSILMNLWLFSAFFIGGYENAGNAIVGRLLGASDYRRIWLLAIDLSKYSLGIASILSLFYLIGYYPIGGFFSHDPQVLASFYRLFWVVLLLQPLNALAFTFDGIYKGLGRARLLRNLLLAATFLGFIPTLYLTDALGWKLYAIWAAFLVWMLIRALGLILNFRATYSRPKI